MQVLVHKVKQLKYKSFLW